MSQLAYALEYENVGVLVAHSTMYATRPRFSGVRELPVEQQRSSKSCSACARLALESLLAIECYDGSGRLRGVEMVAIVDVRSTLFDSSQEHYCVLK